MKVIRDFDAFPVSKKPFLLTIGNFDGVHLGHQAVLKQLVKRSKECKGQSVVVTFENHPSTILAAQLPKLLLCSLPHKLKLFEQLGIETTFLLPFTQELSQWEADFFLDTLRQAVPFSELVLGYDTSFGKNRQGNRAWLEKQASKGEFQVEYLDPVSIEGIYPSSTIIRKQIEGGKLEEAAHFLGRKFSFYGKIIQGKGQGKKIGFPTANVPVKGLCLPPYGVYAVSVHLNDLHLKGVANLGVAPTMRHEKTPLLETHLFDHSENIYGKKAEVILEGFIRPERKFDSPALLSEQIAKDVQAAKTLLKQ